MKTFAFVAAAAAVAFSAPASASTNLVMNGGFETTTLGSSAQFKDNQVAGWTNAKTNGWTGYGYNFLVKSGTADTSGFTSLGGNQDKLYGPNGTNNYANNALTASSPSGGNYMLMDADTNFHGAVSQVINGLTIGQVYTLTFEWAGASWFTTPSTTTHAFDVTFGGVTQSTDTLTVAPQGFSGWQKASMNFTATGAQQTLSFLSQGTPNGLPPTNLLDNVSLTAAVPEPATWAMMMVGFAMVGAASRYRRRSVKAALA